MGDLRAQLSDAEDQLKTVQQALKADPDSEEFLKLKTELEEIILLTQDLIAGEQGAKEEVKSELQKKRSATQQELDEKRRLYLKERSRKKRERLLKKHEERDRESEAKQSSWQSFTKKKAAGKGIGLSKGTVRGPFNSAGSKPKGTFTSKLKKW
eukprot:Clim_evm40s172 gene=Clim_evmTU40s172